MNANWQIDYHCPQCGAPVVLEETDRILTCLYCRTKLVLMQEDGFHCVIVPASNPDREIYYLPYWRIKGSHFWFEDLQVHYRFVDLSQKALPIPAFPPSLGIRPQAVKLKLLSPDTPGIFLAPQYSIRDVFAGQNNIADQGFGDFIGEVISLIFLPVYLEGKTLHDALTNQPTANMPNPSLLRELPKINPASGSKIIFLPTLCPQCGWNLDGEKDALSLGCRNCHSLWINRKGRLERLAFTTLASPGKPDIYLPFWKMRIYAEGFAVDSYADLIRLGNLPKVVNPALESTPLHFWSPAFKINPALYMRWTRIMTVNQPDIAAVDGTESFSTRTFHPVTLPLSEAVEGVRMNLGQLLADKKRLLPILADSKICLAEAELVYHPFRHQNSELVHTTLELTVDRNALSLAVHLS